MSHFAITIYWDGRLELRKLPRGELTEAASEVLWAPIEYCIRHTAEG